MSRPRKAVPVPREHKGSAVLDVWMHGRRRQLVLGPWKSEKAVAEYKRFVAEYATGAYDRPNGDVSINEVMAAHLVHAEQHYRRADGSQTHEVDEYKLVYRLLGELYGHRPAREFGPLALKAVRAEMVKRDWCRSLVNQRIGRVRRIFKWAASEEMIPASVHQGLTTVAGLQRGRTEARESTPVGPVDDAVVDATLAHLNRHVAGLVQFQRLTGCRPGEACVVRRCDIDTGGAVWLYRPAHHKLAYRGKSRTISIGPKAQELLKQFFTPNIDDYLFSPRRATEEHHAERTAKRRTPRYPSHMRRNSLKRASKPEWVPAERYDVQSYGTAIDRACDRAFPLQESLQQQEGESLKKWWKRLKAKEQAEVKAWRKARRWHPNQLRHTFATKVRKKEGLEAAQVLLGHSRADVTQVYAERNEALAVAVAAKIG